MLPTYYVDNYQAPVIPLVSHLHILFLLYLYLIVPLSLSLSLCLSLLASLSSCFPPSGYGFVDFDSPAAAQKAVSSLKATGVQAQMAKVSRKHN